MWTKQNTGAAGALYREYKRLAAQKNRDKLEQLPQSELAASTSPLVARLFAPPGGGAGDAGARGDSPPRGGAAKSDVTIGARFKGELRELMTSLGATRPNFVRCVKPNAAKRGRVFEGSLVMHQLRCAGLFEAIRIRTAMAYSRTKRSSGWRNA